MHPFDERDRQSVLRDLESPDEDVRRLAVERVEALRGSEVVPRLVESLGDASWRVRKAGVERLAALSDADAVAEALIAALADGENPGRRNAAVEALVQQGASAVPRLIGALDQADADVRKFVVDVLAGIGDSRAVETLVSRLADPDPNVGAASADALGAIGGDEAIGALREAAAATSQSSLVRFSALHALTNLDVALRASELASALDDPVLRPAGLALLGRVPDDEEALAILLKGLGSGARACREAAIRSLLGLVARRDGDDLQDLVARIRAAASATPGTLESVVARLEDADLPTRLVLVQFLGLQATPLAALPILRAGRDEALVQVALAGLETLGSVAEQALDEAWHELAAEERHDACAFFGLARGSRSAERLCVALDDADSAVRAAASRSIGVRALVAAAPKLVGRLESAALDEDLDGEEERIAVSEALVALAAAPGSNDVADLIVAHLEPLLDRAQPVRLAVARVLGGMGRPGDAELVALLLRDASGAVRRAAVEALTRLDPETTGEPLRLAIADESPEVRLAAATALGDSSSEEVFDDLRRLASDDDVRVRARAVAAITRRFISAAEVTRRDAAQGVLEDALRDEAPVALAAVEAARAVGGLAASAACSLLSREEPDLVREAVRCLGAHAAADELSDLIPLVGHLDWSVRAEAIHTLAQRRVRRAVPAILRRLETEQDEFVRSETLRALERLEA
jgi:HEAT repeat protein